MILVEKYRPKEFKDVIGIDKRITESINQDMPHLLFVGSPGTGKTTTAKIIIDKFDCDTLILNASDERGIAVIRDKVKSFAMTKSSSKKFKIIYMDEADKLTPDAQDSLRNLMETFHKHVRFILSGNYENLFSDAILSRCVKFRFVEPKKEDILPRLQFICQEESIIIPETLLKNLIDKCYPDIRKMINKLQELSALKRPIIETDIKSEEREVGSLFTLIKEKKVFEARQILLDTNTDYDSLSQDIYHYIMKPDVFNTKTKINLIKKLCEYCKFTNTVPNKEMLFFEFIIKASEEF